MMDILSISIIETTMFLYQDGHAGHDEYTVHNYLCNNFLNLWFNFFQVEQKSLIEISLSQGFAWQASSWSLGVVGPLLVSRSSFARFLYENWKDRSLKFASFKTSLGKPLLGALVL